MRLHRLDDRDLRQALTRWKVDRPSSQVFILSFSCEEGSNKTASSGEKEKMKKLIPMINEEPTTPPAPAVKAGYKTTEFWLSAVAIVAGMVASAGVIPEGGVTAKVFGLVVTILGALGYTVSRTMAKK